MQPDDVVNIIHILNNTNVLFLKQIFLRNTFSKINANE